ncbi:MAG: hypothetical protein FJZ56_06340 [Chlamydiae bacterium]|nr:hypothetical protein [Chlamydiota bacterium]
MKKVRRAKKIITKKITTGNKRKPIFPRSANRRSGSKAKTIVTKKITTGNKRKPIFTGDHRQGQVSAKKVLALAAILKLLLSSKNGTRAPARRRKSS